MGPSPDKPGWFARTLAWPRLFFSRRPDPGTLYDLRGDRAIEGAGEIPLVNMGYWVGIAPKGRNALQNACYALFELVAGGARIVGTDVVLDAGCGFGTNAVFVAQTYGPARVTGVNVSDVQLATARRRAQEAGLADRVDFILASVTRLPLADESVDVVLSVEAAFHFDTREAFFAEAFRVLRKGGRLSLVDLIVPPAKKPWQRVAMYFVLRSQAVPEANVYELGEFVGRVRAAGFDVVAEENIIDRVFPPFRRWILTRPPWVQLRYDLLYLLSSIPYLIYPFDYVRLVARKPD